MSSPSDKASLEGLLEECRREDYNSTEILPAQTKPCLVSRSAVRGSLRNAILHACLILLYTAGSILAVYFLAERRVSSSVDMLCNVDSSVHTEYFANISIAPASEGVIFQAQHFDIVNPKDSKYVQEPSPDVDKAWNNLLQRKSANSPRDMCETDNFEWQTRTSAYQRQ